MNQWRLLLFLFVLTVPAVAARALPGPMAPPIAVFATTVALWFTGIVPLAVTGLLVPVLITLYGISPYPQAFSAFGSDILFLFLGCFFLARAMQKHGWDKRMTYWLLTTRLGERPPAVLIAIVAGMSFGLSMWISNTAACAILVPVCLGIITVVEEQDFDAVDVQRISTRLLLACAYASTMGGLATPIGTPPNLIAIQFLRDRGVEVSFVQWIALGLPLALALFAVVLILLARRHPISVRSIGNVRGAFRAKLAALGPVRPEEIRVAVVFGLTVLFWMLPGLAAELLPGDSTVRELLSPLSLSIVGISAAIVLFAVPTASGRPLLEWSDAREIDWGTILLFGGGITLGSMLEQTGLAAAAGDVLFAGADSTLAVIAIGVVLAILMSEFASNTASAAVVIPVLVATAGPALDLDRVVMGAAFAASFGFMLPVSTPPNAIVFGTGRVELREMVKTGAAFDLVGAAIVVAYLTLLP